MPAGQSGRTPRRSWFVVALTLLVTLQTAIPVWAWGRPGHRAPSRLAERFLNPKAKEAGSFRLANVFRAAGPNGKSTTSLILRPGHSRLAG